MSKEYMVLLVEADEDQHSVDGCRAEVYMRFTEEPSESYLRTVAKAERGKRVYCLMGASTWHQESKL